MEIAINPVLQAYITLADPYLEWPRRLSTAGQTMMRELREAIAEGLEVNPDWVQNAAKDKQGEIASVDVTDITPPPRPKLTPELEAITRAGLRVRQLQRDYFNKGRDKNVLIASKQAEREFDTLLERVALLLPTPPANDSKENTLV